MQMSVSVLCCLIVSLCILAQQGSGAATGRSWTPNVQSSLERADANRQGMENALAQATERQRAGLEFLIENMTDTDLQRLSPDLLAENVRLAYDAFEVAPWKSQVPQDVFLNDVLPYACMDEERENWRGRLHSIATPLVIGCKTPGEAALALNEKLFPLVKVKYSTERKKPNQAPLETMKSGIASCSGLSILLVDACRSVGVPARVAGTPMWTNMRGNHTWVEVWDNGGWHYVGAAEPDPQGLDHGWFANDASQAKRFVPEHAIYASSFKRTDIAFPLVWDMDNRTVPAVNVTERYTAAATTKAPDVISVEVSVTDDRGKRLALPVRFRDIETGAADWTGTSKGETSDKNNYLTIDLPVNRVYEVSVTNGDQTLSQPFASRPAPPPAPGDKAVAATPAIHFVFDRLPRWKEISADEMGHLKQALAEYFAAGPEKQTGWAFPKELNALLRRNEPAVRQAAWEAYKAAPIHEDAHKDFLANQVRFGEYLSPYTLKTVGTRPANGWPLFIAMHGGGNAPKEVNDSQWEIMRTHYREHPEAGGYRYLALRAPNDTWNGFYDVYVYPMIANLIKQFTVFGDVDPDKVFIMGYSHGGYGAFAIGPKEPDLFAAIHGSAAAPTDGETTARTLRSTIFTGMVGSLDTAYGRLDRDRKFAEDVAALRGERRDIYPVAIEVAEGVEHSALNDRDKVAVMYPATRNAVPAELTWLMTDDVIHDFFWLRTNAPGKEHEIDATCRGNHITVTATGGVKDVSVLLDSRLVDFGKSITFDIDGKTMKRKISPSLNTLCETLMRRGDPGLAFTAEVPITGDKR